MYVLHVLKIENWPIHNHQKNFKIDHVTNFLVSFFFFGYKYVLISNVNNMF